MTKLAIKLAERPIYCSSCFNSQPIRHVDFEAACDRGYGNEEAVKIAMDDLVLCEDCVKEAGRLLGMEDEGANSKRIEDLERKWDIEKKRRQQAQNYADTMEDALSNRPEKVHIDYRKRPRSLHDERPQKVA